MKVISKKESAVLAKFCQLINACRTEHCQESKVYNSKKSQILFIQRGLYFIGNEVLLIIKKFDNNKINVQDLIELLNKSTILCSDP